MNTEERLALRRHELAADHSMVDVIRKSEEKAVAAERERCAKIANSVSVAYESESPSRSAVAAHIEKRIRNGDL